jgi:hypothetical protein
MKTIRRHLIAALPITALLGCEVPELPPEQAAAPAATAPAEPESPPPGMVAGQDGELVVDDSEPVSDKPRPVTVRDPIRGRRSREAGGHLGAVGNARFAAEYKMVYEINVPHALNLYWASEGDYPKTHEEFMKNIIAFNKIVLPELPPDREYIYVPEEPDPTKKLMVRATGKPATPPADAPATEPAATPPATPETAAAPADSAAPPEPESGRDEAGNPLDLRERAAGIGGPVLDSGLE